MLRVILIITLISSLYSISFKELLHLTTSQKNTLLWVYKQGKKYNLEYTLTAIVWEESKFGKWNINLNDPSCGIFHNLLGSVADRLHLKPNNWNQSRICEMLIKDKYFALDQAIQELTYWRDYWSIRSNKFIWSKMVGSYNGGYKFNKSYIKRIKIRIKYLRRYINEKRYKK